MPHPHILRRADARLIVVDMQEPFLRVIHDRARLTANVRLLVQAAAVMGVPVLATLQNGARLGGVAPEIADVLPDGGMGAQDKLTFSCAGSEEFIDALRADERRQMIICGVETHICVAQTALDLAHAGFQVHVAADAVSARTMEKHKLGMERIRDSAVLPCAAEAAVYEMLGAAGTPEFKAILALVKEVKSDD